jgi:hypothetical protein
MVAKSQEGPNLVNVLAFKITIWGFEEVAEKCKSLKSL